MLLTEFNRPSQKPVSEKMVADALTGLCNKGATDYISDVRATNKVLLRGIKNAAELFTTHTPYSRKPRGQYPLQQQTLDFILKNSGFESLRTNSMSCTSKFHDTWYFGKVYIIIPHNGFDFTWSKEADIGVNYELNRELDNIYDDYARPSPNGEPARGITRKVIADFIKKYEFSYDDFGEALLREKEVTITGKYTAILADKYRDLFEVIAGVRLEDWRK